MQIKQYSSSSSTPVLFFEDKKANLYDILIPSIAQNVLKELSVIELYKIKLTNHNFQKIVLSFLSIHPLSHYQASDFIDEIVRQRYKIPYKVLDEVSQKITKASINFDYTDEGLLIMTWADDGQCFPVDNEIDNGKRSMNQIYLNGINQVSLCFKRIDFLGQCSKLSDLKITMTPLVLAYIVEAKIFTKNKSITCLDLIIERRRNDCKDTQDIADVETAGFFDFRSRYEYAYSSVNEKDRYKEKQSYKDEEDTQINDYKNLYEFVRRLENLREIHVHVERKFDFVAKKSLSNPLTIVEQIKDYLVNKEDSEIANRYNQLNPKDPINPPIKRIRLN